MTRNNPKLKARTKPTPEVPKYSYAVRWGRRYYTYRQVKFFEGRGFAERYAARLLRKSSDYGPVTDLVVERRRVGPWEGVDEDEP